MPIAGRLCRRGHRNGGAVSSDLRAVPSLDELARDPRRVVELPADAAPRLLDACTHELARYQLLRDHLLIRVACGDGPGEDRERLVEIDEAAALLGRSTDWLYRHAHELPFAVQERKGCRRRFSMTGIRRWLLEHRGNDDEE
jgi:hypothetical protein